MGMGQATGAAAALAIQGGVSPRHLEIPVLQHHLRQAGVILSAPEAGGEAGNPDW